MATLKILIFKNEVIGCSCQKKILKHFIEQVGLTDYEIDKIPMESIDIDHEERVFEKEIMYDDFYGAYLSEEMLGQVGMYIDAVVEEFIQIEDMLHEVCKYLKLTKEEFEGVSQLSKIIHFIAMDLADCDESSPSALMSDYFDVSNVIKGLIQGDIRIT